MSQHHRFPHGRVAGATLSILLGALPAQQPAKPAGPAAPPAAKPVEWPPLKETDKDKVLAFAGQFRKDNAQVREDAKTQLLALGAGAAPLLMQQVTDRADGVNEQLFAVLDAIVTKEHAPLLAREVKKPRPDLRRYLTLRLVRFSDRSLAPVFESLQQDKDEPTAFYARLALFSFGRKEPLPHVLAYTKAHWNEVAPLLADVLAPLRSRELAEAVFEAIAKAPVPDKMTGLRLLRHLMVKEQGVVLRAYLEAADHTVKREAVNTARALHGEAPIDNLSVFQAIEMAKEWAKKL
jgi:hypothetical protein